MDEIKCRNINPGTDEDCYKRPYSCGWKKDRLFSKWVKEPGWLFGEKNK